VICHLIAPGALIWRRRLVIPRTSLDIVENRKCFSLLGRKPRLTDNPAYRLVTIMTELSQFFPDNDKCDDIKIFRERKYKYFMVYLVLIFQV
jgi:hypothetical protein